MIILTKPMKKTTLKLIPAFVAILIVAVPLANATTYTEFTNYAPIAGLPSGSHSLIFSETRFTTYGTEHDSIWGNNEFSIQLNAYYKWGCGFLNLGTCELAWQAGPDYICSVNNVGCKTGQYASFWTNSEILYACLSSLWCSNPSNPVYYQGPNVEDPTAIPTASLSSYVVLAAINTGSSSQSVTVTSCNVGVTVQASSMYLGIFNINTCKMQWSHTDVFPATAQGQNLDNTNLQDIQVGAIGVGGGSQASFTQTVISHEMWELTCVFAGCTYSYQSGNSNGCSNGWTCEYSNTNFWISNDAGGYHINICQESTDESVCKTS